MGLTLMMRRRIPGSKGSRTSFLRKGETDFLFQERFKALRAKFEYMIDAQKVKVVAVTSAIAGEGKTVSCLNLAKNLASAGRKKILLIDMDLHKSDLTHCMEIAPVPGLTDYLNGSVGVQEIVRNSVVDGLYLVPSGSRPAESSDVIAGERFRTFLKQVREHFDTVLLDTPPVVPVADTMSLRDQVDGFLFIFRASFTPYTMLKEALEDVGENKVLGIVLNGVEPETERYYRQYYGNYYRKQPEEKAPD